MSPPCFVANWKMNKTIPEALEYASVLLDRLPKTLDGAQAEVILAAPFTALSALSSLLSSRDGGVWLAAQDVSAQPDGPYTGNISARMLCDVGCRYVIVGHSERRTLFGETDHQIAQKISAICSAGEHRHARLVPILCVGETASEREKGLSQKVVAAQLQAMTHRTAPIIIAYEPVWAVGTGKRPPPSEINAMHQYIREQLHGVPEGESVRILYGGSVEHASVSALMREPHIDGVLVGHASLSVTEFLDLIERGLK